jgi:phytoene dehydrogenase-like protein
MNAVAPNFKGSIMHRQIIGPRQMQQDWGLIGGNIFHGELTVDQLFHMRPRPGTRTTARRSAASTRRRVRRTRAAA